VLIVRKRIAYGRIAQETNCFSPVATTLDDFRKQHYFEGDALANACARGGVEAPGFLKRAELKGFLRAVEKHGRNAVDTIPLLSAWAVPGGPLDRETFDTLVARLTARLREAAPVDGVFLSLHGAMGVAGVRDPDTAIIRAVRDVVGLDVPIAATFDLHANFTAERIAATDIARAYHTNPHRDHAATGERTGRALLRAVLEGARPVTAWHSLPILLGGGSTVDILAPMRAIFRRLDEIERDPRVLTASVLMCHPWNDDPALGWSVQVTTDGDSALAQRLADELAERCWSVREEQPPAFSDAAHAIAEARRARLARRLGVVVFADASDVVSAGATGENTRLLEALLRDARELVSYVPIRDAVAIRTLWQHAVGDRVALSVGGRLDPARNRPLAISGVVRRLVTLPGFERVAVLDLGHVRLVVTEGPALAIRPAFYRDVGLPILDADVVVVKNFFPFRLFFLPYARKTIYVRTGGITDVDAAFALAFDGPMHPRDVVHEWRTTRERRQKGVEPTRTTRGPR
jgi:microcystin degradation protein MlrC